MWMHILPNKIDKILHELNSYHPNIKFTCELESYDNLVFLDVSARRTNDNKVETSVCRKATWTNIYINWDAHAPLNWKIVTLRSLIKRRSIRSSELLLRNEMISTKYLYRI